MKNGRVTGANSAVVDLAAFNVKACISAALQHMTDDKSALHDLVYPPQGLTRSLHKDRESLEEGWQDRQIASFTNTSIKHATIAIADIGASLCMPVSTLSEALRIRKGTYGDGLAMLTKYIY